MKNDAAEASSGEQGGNAAVPAEQDAGALAERAGPSAVQVARGAGGLGVVWGGTWAGMAGGLGLAAAALTDYPLEVVLASTAQYGIWGFLSGAAFALVLTTMERKGSLEDLGYLRMSLWGGVGGLVVGVVMLLILGALPILGIGGILLQALRSAVLGASSAAATTWLAKSGPGGGDGAPAPADHDGGM